MPKTIRFITLGCKVNQYDSEAMLELFLQSGYVPAEPGEPADVCVVNTCTVTGTGDQKSLQAARRYKRENPSGELVLAGCLAQRRAEELRKTGARLILGTQHRARVVTLLEKAIAENAQLVAVDSLQSAAFEPLCIHAHEGHTRAVMKIQEGCENRCTYCVIPSVRGPIRSRPAEDVRREAQALADAGFAELVLTGIHLTSYGRDLEGRPKLMDAVRAASEPAGVKRIRLGSLEPAAVNDAFATEAAKLPKLCPQFHLSLQSGSDAILAAMKRRYNTAQFMAAVERLRAVFPDAAFTTDVIAGFPGETEAAFEETVDFCRRVGFLKLHVFPFSPREGTPAAIMPGQVPKDVKSDRVRRLIAVGETLSAAYRRKLVGTVQPVLLEERGAAGMLNGYTPQYVHVAVRTDSLPGRIVNVRLKGLSKAGMTGEPVETIE
jgi:threonylcarbamoyladenosine tRNA methylthiotransferase MtaB